MGHVQLLEETRNNHVMIKSALNHVIQHRSVVSLHAKEEVHENDPLSAQVAVLLETFDRIESMDTMLASQVFEPIVDPIMSLAVPIVISIAVAAVRMIIVLLVAMILLMLLVTPMVTPVVNILLPPSSPILEAVCPNDYQGTSAYPLPSSLPPGGDPYTVAAVSPDDPGYIVPGDPRIPLAKRLKDMLEGVSPAMTSQSNNGSQPNQKEVSEVIRLDLSWQKTVHMTWNLYAHGNPRGTLGDQANDSYVVNPGEEGVINISVCQL